MGSPPAQVSRLLGVFSVFLIGAFWSVRAASAEHFDWSDVDGQNFITPVKQQWGGTCWAHADIALLEAKYKITRNDPNYSPDLSEQQLVWETNPDMGSTSGGAPFSLAVNYFCDHGVVSEAECPAQGTDIGKPPYWPLASGWQDRVWKAESCGADIGNIGTAALKDAIKKYGPLVENMAVDEDWYDPPPGSHRGYHAVLIVGFHDDGSAPGGGYWIVKNSWGGGWNGDGYGAIAYASRPLHATDTSTLTGAVYRTGPIATVTWQGGSGTWVSGGNHWSGVDQYGNPLPTYAWENKETSATFNASSGTNIDLSGTVIAHGLTISSGATGYVFDGVGGDALTVTAGGITAHETATINAPVTIGAPQTWTVDNGKWLTVGGDVHTIISNLTIRGPGTVVVSGSIDGGGAINSAGATPGKITVTNGAYIWLDGNADYSVDIEAASGSHGVAFAQEAGEVGHCYGVISGGGWIDKYDQAGTIVLHAANTYTNWTSIYGGAVQADSGGGLPTASFLNLNGGVLQSNGTTTFTRSLGISGSNKFWWQENGGGFAGGAGPMTVRVGNGTSTLTWGTTKGTNIVGTLKFGSLSAANSVHFQNGINLGGGDRTVQVDDNPFDSGDFATISGAISGTGSLTKTGLGTLYLSGSAGNTYTGTTTVTKGIVWLDKSSGAAIPGNLNINGDGTGNVYVRLSRDEQIANSAVVSFSNVSPSYSRLYLEGHTETVAGISCPNDRGVIQNGHLIVDNAEECFYAGYMRNTSGTFTLEKRGTGTLTLSGSHIYYTGGTTVTGGKLVLQDTTSSSYCATGITNNATLEFDTATTDINFTGTISGTGALRKTGSNKLKLGSASNSYDGTTTVYDGVLSASSTAVPSAISIRSGGAFAPGDIDVIGSVTTGAATWYGGGQYLFEISDANGIAGTNWDLWGFSGNLSITPTFTISVTTLSGTSAGEMADFDNELSYSWLLAETTGLIDGFGYLDLDTSGFQNELASAGYLHMSQSGDYRQLYLSYSLSVPGDANRDNHIDEADAGILAAHWGQSGGWTDGDFEGDGVVGPADAAMLAAHWGYSMSESTGVAVPEPSTLLLLGMGAIGLLVCRRRNHS